MYRKLTNISLNIKSQSSMSKYAILEYFTVISLEIKSN